MQISCNIFPITFFVSNLETVYSFILHKVERSYKCTEKISILNYEIDIQLHGTNHISRNELKD